MGNMERRLAGGGVGEGHQGVPMQVEGHDVAVGEGRGKGRVVARHCLQEPLHDEVPRLGVGGRLRERRADDLVQ